MFEERGFSFDLSKIPVSKYRKVRIELDTEYKWGRGWVSREARDRFHMITENALLMNDFSVRQPEFAMAAPSIVFDENDDGLSLYFHPMELTGYVPEDQLNKLLKVLREDCKEVIGDVRLVRNEPCYDLSDKDYADLIKSKSKEIVKCIKEERSKHRYDILNDIFEIGTDFAREVRIPRAGKDKPGYYSGDADIRAIMDICLEAEKEGYFAKDKDLDDPEAERE